MTKATQISIRFLLLSVMWLIPRDVEVSGPIFHLDEAEVSTTPAKAMDSYIAEPFHLPSPKLHLPLALNFISLFIAESKDFCPLRYEISQTQENSLEKIKELEGMEKFNEFKLIFSGLWTEDSVKFLRTNISYYSTLFTEHPLIQYLFALVDIYLLIKWKYQIKKLKEDNQKDVDELIKTKQELSALQDSLFKSKEAADKEKDCQVSQLADMKKQWLSDKIIFLQTKEDFPMRKIKKTK